CCTIAHTLRGREITAPRDFDPADVRVGSTASGRYGPDARGMSASPPIASKHWHGSETSFSARKRHMHRTKQHHYSITSSARQRTEGGIVRSRDFAVLRFTANSNFVGCSTGSSAGLTPLRTLATMIADCRHIAARLGP